MMNVPVFFRRVDGTAIGPGGSGKPGPVTQKLQAVFQRFTGG